jgi:hypothetical protein
MSFLVPLMLIGLIAVAAPVIIHLIGRNRARVVRFAALDFLLATKRRTARRLQLREHLLLAVRALICLAIPLALAKPFTSCQRAQPQVTRGPQAAVIVIDDSFAAGYALDGQTMLALAVDKARRILVELGPEAEVAIVRASAGAEQPTDLSRDHLRLRDELTKLATTARPPDLVRALARAAQLLVGSPHQRHTVYLLSPLGKGGYRAGDPAWGKEGPTLEVIDLRGGRALPNVAVTDASASSESAVASRGVSVTAEIANFGIEPVTGLEVRLDVSGRAVARSTVDLMGGERRSKRFLAVLPAGSRGADLKVSIASDALAIDNHRWIRSQLRDEVRVLLVNGDPRTTRHDDELYYAAAALRPGDRDDSGTQLATITVDDLATTDLGEFDVVILANVLALQAARVQTLMEWVAAGGGLLITAGDHVEAAAYERTMTPLLPQSIKDPIDVTWTGGTQDQRVADLHLSKWEGEHPIFAPFGPDAPSLSAAKFSKILLLGPTTETHERKVLARFTNGAAALVESTLGQGRTMLYTSTLDRDWNDLPIHPGFLPLVQQAVRHLAGKHASQSTRDVLVGQGVSLPIGDLARLEVRGPLGINGIFEQDRLSGRRSVRFARSDAPGIYQVFGADSSAELRPRDELSFAVNLDARGSDLSEIDRADLPASGTGGGSGAEPAAHRIELWHAIAAALLLLLLLEGLLTQR